MPRLPTIPGELVAPEQADQLREYVAALLGLPHTGFPGSQPVSFKKSDLQRLEQEDYWVCEKSDGLRVLTFIFLRPSGEQEVYLIDRKNDYRRVKGLHFPHVDNPNEKLGSTFLDAELVLDFNKDTGEETLRMLCFDCIAVNGHSIGQENLTFRYEVLREWVLKPYENMINEVPSRAKLLPFDIKAKRMDVAYSVNHVLKEIIPNLQHGHDGLIYTCVNSKYAFWLDETMLKWKPPSEQSLDVKIQLAYPMSSTSPGEKDTNAKPLFMMMQWLGESNYEFYDTMRVDDDEWERIKPNKEQYEGRIVEVAWDFEKSNWRVLRFRDDKAHANHKDVIHNVISSIIDGVKVEELVNQASTVQLAWKERAARGMLRHSGQAHMLCSAETSHVQSQAIDVCTFAN